MAEETNVFANTRPAAKPVERVDDDAKSVEELAVVVDDVELAPARPVKPPKGTPEHIGATTTLTEA